MGLGLAFEGFGWVVVGRKCSWGVVWFVGLVEDLVLG